MAGTGGIVRGSASSGYVPFANSPATTAPPISMPNRQSVNLGGIELDESLFEVPQDFQFGYENWLSVAKIPQTGSTPAKIIAQTFGVFPKPIEWEARFLRQNVVKYRQLAGLMNSHTVVTLTVGALAWDCVITDLTITQRSRWDLGYKIKLTPLRDRGGIIPARNLVSIDATTQLKTTFAGLTNALVS